MPPSGYGHAEQGGIDGGPATLDEQTLRERYLPPWKAIADAGMLRGVMCSQSAVNHIPMHVRSPTPLPCAEPQLLET